MARSTEKRGLGRGLSALMADIDAGGEATPSQGAAAVSSRPDRTLPIEDLRANPDQPRRMFRDEELRELAQSIEEHGIIQPLIVRPDPSDTAKYQIVAGERRWRAAQIAKLHDVPVVVRNFDENELLQVAIIENIQRADLNPMEEAQGYKQLMDRFGHTQLELSTAMGKSRSHLANVMRLLQLPDEIQTMVRDGQLSAGHARALLTAHDPLGLARRAIAEDLSVRAVEKAAKSTVAAGPRGTGAAPTAKDADTRALEADLTAALSTKVRIDHDAQSGKGRISIYYKDLEKLDDLMRVLNAT